MRNIYLLRHCETEHFEKKRCVGITDVKLNEKRYPAGTASKEIFQREKPERHFLCSDTSRASETARIISGGKITVQVLSDLHEINMGDWDGMYFDEIKVKFSEEYRQRGIDFAEFTQPRGESFADCQNPRHCIRNGIKGKTSYYYKI